MRQKMEGRNVEQYARAMGDGSMEGQQKIGAILHVDDCWDASRKGDKLRYVREEATGDKNHEEGASSRNWKKDGGGKPGRYGIGMAPERSAGSTSKHTRNESRSGTRRNIQLQHGASTVGQERKGYR